MELEFRRVRVTTTYLRRDGTTGRASHEVWADSIKDARRHPQTQLGGQVVRVRAQWAR